MGNPMPLHKQMESVVGTGAAPERTQRYRVMAQWKQQRLIRVVEGSLSRGDLSYPVSTRHKTIRIEIGPETYFTVRDTSDYPNEMLIAQIMLAINSTSPPWIWQPRTRSAWAAQSDREAGLWQPRGQTIRVVMGYQVGVDQLMHRAVDENSDIAASMMAKQIDEEILHTMLGKASPLTNATLPPPVKRKP